MMSSTTTSTPITTTAKNSLATAVVSKTVNNNINGKVTTFGGSKDTPFTYTYGSVCLLCLRTKTCTSVKSDPDKHRESRRICVKYVVLVSRYLKLETELTKASQKNFLNSACELKEALGQQGNDIDFKEEINKFIICDLCLPLADSFCKTYQEYELIRMKLEAKILESTVCVEKSEVLGESLKVIRGIKRGAGAGGGVTAKGSSGAESNPDEDALIGFRSMLKIHGSKFNKYNEPRLHLKRDKRVEELIQQKMPKLSPNSSVNSVKDTEKKTSTTDDPTSTPTPSRSQPTSNVKIVRKSAGKKSSEGPEISIIRVTKETPVEANNNDSDIQIINVVQKKAPVAPTSTTVNVAVKKTTTPPVIQQNNSAPPPPVTLLLNTNVLQGNLIPIFPLVQTQQDLVNSNSSSAPSPNPNIVPIQIRHQQCNINGCGITVPVTMKGMMDMQRHLHTHGDLACSKCPSVLKTPFELISHELKHDENNPNRKVIKQGFQCTRCPRYSMLRTEHQEHFFERHLNSKIELLKCNICKKGFSHLKEQQYHTHVSNCHPVQGSHDFSRCHICMICRVYFRKKGTLWKHLKNDHRISCQDGQYKCVQCLESFSFQSLLDLHQQFGCGNKQTHKCPYAGCLATFPLLDSVKQHIEIAHSDISGSNQVHECPICKFVFTDLEELKIHVVTHNGEQVKLVFSEGCSQEAQVIPVQAGATTISSSSSSGASLETTNPSIIYTPATGESIHELFPSITPPPNPGTPVIVSVTGTPPTKSLFESNALLPTQGISLNMANQAGGSSAANPSQSLEVDTKMFEQFFDESNDSEEHLMDLLESAITVNSGEDELSPPEEDPFAWMLEEDFDIS